MSKSGGTTVFERTRFVFEFVLLAMFTYGFIGSLSFPPKGAYFPIAVSVSGIGLMVTILLVDFIKLAKGKPVIPTEIFDNTSAISNKAAAVQVVKDTAPYILWIGSLYLLVFLLTFPVGAAIWLFLMVKIGGKLKLLPAILVAIIPVTVLCFVIYFMNLVVFDDIWVMNRIYIWPWN